MAPRFIIKVSSHVIFNSIYGLIGLAPISSFGGNT